MTLRPVICLSALLLAACDIHFEREDDDSLSSICTPLMFEDTPFTHCIAHPDQHRIGTDLAPEGEDTPWRSLRDFSFSEDAAGPVLMATNAGMFDEAGQPIGYYVEDGRRLSLLNQNDGPGNFHLLPNGIFFGEADGPWQVMETGAFAASIDERPYFATQSGPMLVIDGELHPAFERDGSSRKIRNGVGVDAFGRAHFLISEAPVSLGKFARLYRDVLNVDNALYLDGTVSLLWDAPDGRMDTGAPIGPLLVVEARIPNGDQDG